jgi:uncharacterized protein YerC|tara:strand:- start:804 stop:1316 length:513 start_codon:yes stop_codon:yes gene_type:complete
MSNLNLLEMTNDIHNFIKKFEYKYGLTVDIRIGAKKSQITYNKNSLRVIEAAIISKMHEDHPTLSHITSFKNRARATRIMRYSQAFQHIAFKSGYTKTSIAKFIKRNHASTINAIKQAENYLFCNHPKFTDIYFWSILKLNSKENYHVGTISNDAKQQHNTKSMSTAIWD